MKRNRESKARIRLVNMFHMNKLQQRQLDEIVIEKNYRYYSLYKNGLFGVMQCSLQPLPPPAYSYDIPRYSYGNMLCGSYLCESPVHISDFQLPFIMPLVAYTI
jgi:hypothetical protein